MIGDFLKQLRNNKKINENNFLNEIGIEEKRWNELESNIEEPNAQEILNISKYFNISTDELLNGIVLKRKVKIFLILLFILNLCSIWIAIWAMFPINNSTNPVKSFYHNMNPNFTYFSIILLGTSIISLILGQHYKKQGYKCKKNIILGMIFLVLFTPTCINGLFNTSNKDTSIIGKQHITEIVKEIDFEIPTENAEIICFDKKITSNTLSKNIQISYVFNNYDDNIAFKKSIENSEKWTKKLDKYEKFLLFSTTSLTESNFDYFLIYNKNTKKYNDFPDKNKSSDYYFIIYKVDEGFINIYDLNIKEELYTMLENAYF